MMKAWKWWLQSAMIVLVGVPLTACTTGISNGPRYSEDRIAAMSRNMGEQTIYPVDGGRISYLDVWIKKAQSGDSEAQTYVGEIYERGLGVPTDYAKAAQWYRKAAEQGYSRAQNNLGFLYEKGLGVPNDPAQALSWYRKAANLDVVLALGGDASGELRALRDEVSRKADETEVLRRQLQETKESLEKALNEISKLKSDRQQTSRDRRAEQELQRVVQEYRQRERQLSSRVEALEAELEKSRRALQSKEGDVVANVLSGVDFGHYHALIIGNAEYRSLDRLKTPITDARDLDRMLKQKYGFRSRLLLNATREQILTALVEFRDTLQENDNFLLYYAGHGKLDGGVGNWQGVASTANTPGDWISNADITSQLEQMRALHVLVIADSCYSGTLTRGSFDKLASGAGEKERVAWIRGRAAKRSRIAIGSGGVQPVLDTGQGDHSVFANALLRQLKLNDDIMASRALYDRVAPEVLARARMLGARQEPEFGRVQGAFDENGEFYFLPVARQAVFEWQRIAAAPAPRDWMALH